MIAISCLDGAENQGGSSVTCVAGDQFSYDVKPVCVQLGRRFNRAKMF